MRISDWSSDVCSSDLFTLNCRSAADGDRDGLPNVLMEAQALGLPVVSTNVSAVPELVEHGRNGLLAPADDPAALGALIAELITLGRESCRERVCQSV